MSIKWYFVLCGLLTVNASINISYQDIGLSVCVRKILSRITECINATTDVSLIDNENVVVQNLQKIKGVRFITRTQSWANNEIYNTIYVMSFKNYSDMKNGFNVTMKDNYWTPISNFIIILEHVKDLLVLDKMTRFLVFNNLYNVTFLRKVENDYTIYTFHSPIHACNHRPHLVKMTQCLEYNGGSYIFPTISLHSLRGCRFKLAAHNFFPMVNFDNNKSEGWEQRMMQIFGERQSMVFELVEYSKIDKLGRIVGNYSYVDLLNKVRADEVEGAIGGYFVGVNALRKFSFSYPIIIDHIIVIMPQALFFDTWRAVFHQAFYVIMLVFSLIIIFSILAYLLALFPSIETDPARDFMIVFGYFLNKITVREMKKGVPETFIILSLLFSVFIIPYYMQAFMCSVKTHPIRGYEANEFEEIQEKYQLIVPKEWEKRGLAQNSNDCTSRLDCLKQVSICKDRMQYTMISEMLYEPYRWMIMDEQCSLDVYKVRDPIVFLLRTVYFRHGSVIVQPFDKFLLDFVASGLLKKHYEDLIFKERVKCKFRAKPPHDTLTLKDLKQSFTILIGGYCLSTIFFAFEVLTKNK